MAVEKFREMGIQQLRQQASLRGISATGSKKELIERLSKDSNHDLQDCPQGIYSFFLSFFVLCLVAEKM